MDNKVKKHWWLFSLILVFFGLLFMGIVFYKVSPLQRIADISKRISNTNGVTKIEVGKTYKFGGFKYIKFIDEKHYVYFIDEARYKNNDELNKERREQDYQKIYPQRTFIVGTIRKRGKDFQLIAKSEVVILFKNISNQKNNIYSEKYLNLQYNPEREYFTLSSTITGYKVNKKEEVMQSNLDLPNSIDEFLAQYDYVPEELN